ncbi:MAG: hypothetical protein HYY93_03525 [Planctomycetes bacterium]|nr:hypothetical protein [Planctomycetota bacterium]
MILANVVAAVVIVIGFLMAFPALWLTLNSAFPETVGRCQEQVRVRPGRSFLAGLPVVLVCFMLGSILVQSGAAPNRVLAASLVSLTFLASAIGVAGIARHLGSRMPSPVDEKCPWRMLLRGGVALELACLLPFAGWAVILPVSWVTGLGAMALSLLSRSRQTPASIAPVLPSTSAVPGAATGV